MTQLPRAVGSRLPYRFIPARVQSWVEDSLGASVTVAVDQVGGMSPGCAARLQCADGSRAFVKAVGPELNPDTPLLFRREATVLGLIGSKPLWADLLDVYDEPDGWVALLLEDIEGQHPDLRDDATMRRVLEATEALAEELGRHDPHKLGPHAATLNDLGDRFHRWAGAFDHIGNLPDSSVHTWARKRADDLQERMREIAGGAMDSLVHWDVRDDNVLQRPDGSIVFVDWGQAAIGPSWCDPLLARFERVDEAWFDHSVRTSPALLAAGDELVTAWMCGFAVFLAYRAHTAVDLNLPALRAFRSRKSARAFVGAARRLGITG